MIGLCSACVYCLLFDLLFRVRLLDCGWVVRVVDCVTVAVCGYYVVLCLLFWMCWHGCLIVCCFGAIV